MAIVRAVKSGNWSDTTVWNTGALPTSADDVYSNTFTVTIDQSATVLQISNASATGVTAGGGFTMSAGGYTLTANVNASATVDCLTVSVGSGSIASVVGNVQAGSTGRGINMSGTGTLNITGNITGGTGNLGYGVNNNSSGTLSITGSVTGGSGLNAHGCYNASSGTTTITGTLTGGSNASIAAGALNAAGGTLSHVGIAQASTTSAAIGPGTISQITIITGPLISTDAAPAGASVSGVNPCTALRWFPADTAISTFEYRMRGQTLSGSPSIRPARSLYLTDAYSTTYPIAANVRSSTTYGPGNIYTGTCAVPPAGSVALGVPVDNTIGTATISAASIRSALGMASANLDTQLGTLSTNQATMLSNQSTMLTNLAAVPANVWAVLTSTLTTAGSVGKLLVDNINATISSAAADSSGVTTLLSRLTSGRAAGLDNLDAAVSSRLASSSYSAAPSAAQVRQEIDANSTQLSSISSTVSGLPSAASIATAVWSAATRTLTTAIDNSATIAAAVWNSLTGSYNTNGTFGKQVLIGSTAQREVAITGSHHVAADIHELQPAVIDASHFATGALDSVRTSIGLASANLDAQLNALPTAAENATATRSELAPELARAANVATTQEVGDLIEEALQ